MKIDLKQQRLIPIYMLSCLILRVAVSFNVFGFLQIVSYLVLGLTILNFLVMGCIFLRKPRMSRYDALVFIFVTLLVTFTILNATDTKEAIYTAIEIALLILVFNYYCHMIDTLLRTIALTFSCCVYANLAMMLMFPDWMFAAEDEFNSFLLGGNYNQMGCRFVLAIASSLLCANYSKKWLYNSIAVIIVSISTLGIVGSMTSLSSIAVLCLILLIPSRQLRRFAVFGFFSFFVLFQVFVCFSGEGLYNNDLAVYLVEDVLEKDLSFTGRTYLWDLAGGLFLQSPLIGYGYVGKEWFLANMTSFAIGPHNFIYALLIYGGIVLLGLYLTIFTIGVRHIVASWESPAIVLMTCITTLHFMMTMEVYPMFFILLLLTLSYYYPQLKASWNCLQFPQEPSVNEI